MLPSMLRKKLKLSNITESKPGKVNLKRKNKSDPSKKKPKRKVDHFKALTTDEINRLRETEDVTNESLFALQITEIIKAAKPSEKYEHFIRTWTSEFCNFILALPSDTEKRPLSEWVATGLKAPLDETKLNIPDFDFQFVMPQQTLVIGSGRMETSIGPCFTIDLVVEIPAKCFQKTDYLNMIYHKKKALYLSYLAQKLSTWSNAAECKFQFFANDKFNPVLVIRPKSSKKVIFNVHVCCESNTFKLNRFLPSTSNIRSSLFGDIEKEILPTPHYNSSVLADMTLLQNEEFLNHSLNGVPNIKNAVVLFKLWLRTRGLERSGFNGFVASMFAVWLLKQKKINVSMTVYEVVKNLWINLAMSKWNESGKGISLNPTQTDLGLFHEYFDVVFLELNGANNICANIYLDVYLRVRDESAKSIQFLSKATINNFRYLFTNKMPVNLQFDQIIVIKESVNLEDVMLAKAPQAVIQDFCGDWYPVAVTVISKTLRRGFDKRIASMMPLTPELPFWNIDTKCPKYEPRLSFGLILNAEFATNVVDKGPQHDDEGAEQFKMFWGDKSELRRFTDGTIVEACLWNSPSDALAKKRVICKAITLHLLNYHYGIRPSEINYVADEFDVAYQLESTHFLFEDKEDNAENLAFAVIKSFEEVSKHLRALDNIPLDISSVLGTSPVFRYCEVEPIMAQSNEVIDGKTQIFQSYAVNEGVIQFSANGKWPNDLAVIEQIKAAFYVRIAQGMQEQFQLPARGNTQYVEIIKNGFLYRLRIALPKELQLRRQYITPKGIVSHRDTAESLHIEKNLFLLPTLTVSLHTIYHQHTSFGPAVLIAKRWLFSQLLNPYLWPDECTELLMAYVYMQTNSVATPTQPQAAFFRLLHLLATNDWDKDMVLLNFNDILSDESVRSLETRFASDRESFPPLCIVTSWDNKAFSVWTKKAPISAVISRVAVLASHALRLVQLEIGSDAGLDPRALFVPSLDGYDVVITLRKTHVQTCNLYDFASSTKRSTMVDKTVPAADFNLAQYFLRDLRAAYDEFAVFFHDPRGGEVITVLWKPTAHISQDFEVGTIYGRKSDANNKYAVNFKQIIEDFRIIGKGLVETINVTDSNSTD